VRQLYQLDSFTDQALRLNEASIEGLWSREQQKGMDRQYLSGDLNTLWQAVLQDFEEGTIGVRYLFDSSQERWDNTSPADLTLNWTKEREVPPQTEMSSGSYTVPVDDKYDYYSLTITLTPNAKHTLQWLDEHADIQFGDELRTYSEVRAASDTQLGKDLHLDVDLIP
jgi:ABC-2 type transport system permease protein